MSKNQEATLTVSGHQYDKDLARVPIKVSPALQALIANQLDLIEIVEKNHPESNMFIEHHRLELLQVEEEISYAFGSYVIKKEKAREKRELKKANPVVEPAHSQDEFVPFEEFVHEEPARKEVVYKEREKEPFNDVELENTSYTETEFEPSLDAMADKLSPGLPSAKYEQRSAPVEAKPEVDVRRVAIGASIKALVTFLGRELNEEEIVAIEKQVDSYLV